MTFELTAVEILDLMVRGGTIGILVLLIIHLIRMSASPALTTTGLVFTGSGIIESVVTAPLFTEAGFLPPEALLSLQQFHFVALHWFVLVLFDDHFCWRPHCFFPAIVGGVLVAATLLAPAPYELVLRYALIAFNAGLLVLIIMKALEDRASDLVDDRRRFRQVLAFVVPPFTLFVFVLNILQVNDHALQAFCLLYSGSFFIMAAGFSYWMTNLKPSLFQIVGNTEGSHADDPGLSSADRLELDRVVKAVEGGLYLEAGLTIGGLAQIMRIPEHRLRKLINSGLGYRNFAAFLNDYRITEAKRRLADPGLAREQIIQHAFALGYASLAPFNRAFRERVGVSPTEYREKMLGRVISGDQPAMSTTPQSPVSVP